MSPAFLQLTLIMSCLPGQSTGPDPHTVESSTHLKTHTAAVFSLGISGQALLILPAVPPGPDPSVTDGSPGMVGGTGCQGNLGHSHCPERRDLIPVSPSPLELMSPKPQAGLKGVSESRLTFVDIMKPKLNSIDKFFYRWL